MSSSAQVDTLGADVAKSTTGLLDTLANLDPAEEICNPLIQLREQIETDTPEEYSSTGLTPQRKKYSVSTNIPRTESREELLARLRCEPAARVEDTALTLQTWKPSTGIVFADPPTVHEAAPSTEQDTTNTATTTARGNGLRELDPNAIRLTEPSSIGMLPPKKRQRASAASELPVAKTRRKGYVLRDDVHSGERGEGPTASAGVGSRITRAGAPRRLRSTRKTGA